MYDSGTLYICNLINQSENGDMPKEVLSKVNKFWFEKRYIGINRQYLAKGANEQVDLLVRIHGSQNINIGQYVMLGNGEQYRITMVNQGFEQQDYTRMVDKKYYKTARIIGLDYTELTLTKLEKNYELEIEEN